MIISAFREFSNVKVPKGAAESQKGEAMMRRLLHPIHATASGAL
jgi:hypothetical protein